MMKKTGLVLALFGFVACGGDGSNPDIPVQNLAVVVAGDFTPGSPGVMSALDLDTMEIEQRVAPNGAVGEDPVIRRFGSELFVVNRAGGNNVTILDATTFEVIEQLATGAGSNPQDIAVVADELYIPATGTAGVVVVQRGTGATRTIDLSELDAADGLPDCVSAFVVGANVFVACGKLDTFVANEPGTIAVIDTAAADEATFLELANLNPFGLFEQRPDNGELVIPTVPDFADFSTGCVERIDTRVSPPVALGCGVTNQELGGFAARVDFQTVDGTTIQWMVVSSFDTEPRGNLQGLDLGTDELIAPVSPTEQVLVDLAVCRDQSTIIVADANLAANGLRSYSNDIEVTPDGVPLAIGLKPGSAHGLACY